MIMRGRRIRDGPILAMLKDLAATRTAVTVIFFYGARSRRDLFLVDELEEPRRSQDWFTFVPALSEPDRGRRRLGGQTGLITEVLARHLHRPGGWSYLCGPPPMIDAAIDVLKPTGCKERHIYFDGSCPPADDQARGNLPARWPSAPAASPRSRFEDGTRRGPLPRPAHGPRASLAARQQMQRPARSPEHRWPPEPRCRRRAPGQAGGWIL